MIFLDLIKTAAGPVIDAIVGLIPDKRAAQEKKLELETAITQAAITASAQQGKINELEAQHKSVFVAGWRPAAGWVCVAGLAYAGLVQPFLAWIVTVAALFWDKADQIPALPVVDTDTLYNLLIGLLGLGSMRLWEKTKGVARETSPFKGKQ